MPKYKITIEDEKGKVILHETHEKFLVVSGDNEENGLIRSTCIVEGIYPELARMYVLLGKHIYDKSFTLRSAVDSVKPKPEPKNKIKTGD